MTLERVIPLCLRLCSCLCLCLCFCLIWTPSSFADDPDSEQNPVTGCIETVSSYWNGTDFDLQLTIDRGALPPLTYEIISGGPDDSDPQIAIAGDGAAWFAWTRDASTNEVRARGRLADGEFGPVLLVSDSSESSSNPTIALDGATVRIVYEIAGSGSTSVAVAAIDDEPDPIGQRTIVGTTTWTGALDARIHVEAGHTWLTFVHDADELGWSELIDGSWSGVEYESLGTSDVESARAAIRDGVLGL